jgi:tRNA 2-thiouridine synthesizing protein A
VNYSVGVPHTVSPARIIDARGSACPVPILELARALRGIQPGEEVLLLATDPAIEADLRAFCGATGHVLLSLRAGNGEYRAHLRKSAA